MFVLRMLSFFWEFSLGPQEGRTCAATSDFVATGITGTNGDKCRLLLVEDPALKAQPRHEVVVGVFGPSPPPPPPAPASHRGVRGLSAVRHALRPRQPGAPNPVESRRDGCADRGPGRPGEALTQTKPNDPPPPPPRPQRIVHPPFPITRVQTDLTWPRRASESKVGRKAIS